jgi:SAM-dependent methyltransferase
LDAELRRRLDESGYDRPGFAERYDRFRPRPPQALVELLPPLTGLDRLRLVADLGCGTGLSTRIWAEAADEVVGVEPNEAMLRRAEAVTAAGNVRYVNASGYATGLPDGCADVVTASQSLQWMRPELVFPELARILAPRGIFCAYEYFALQTPLWEPEHAFGQVVARTRVLREQRGLDREKRIWPISRERLEESGAFHRARELALHSVEAGDGERLVGFALSQGSLATLLEDGATEEEVGLDRLRAVAAEVTEPIPWWIGYKVWLAVT